MARIQETVNNARGTILLAEDNEDDVFFMQRAIKAAGVGHSMTVVPDGQAVIDYLLGEGGYADRNAYPIPFLLFLDLKMPRRSGLEVLQWIRSEKQFQTLLVLILTTSKEDSDVERAYSLGVNSFLVKPPSAHQLNELMKTIKAYWLDNPQLATVG